MIAHKISTIRLIKLEKYSCRIDPSWSHNRGVTTPTKKVLTFFLELYYTVLTVRFSKETVGMNVGSFACRGWENKGAPEDVPFDEVRKFFLAGGRS